MLVVEIDNIDAETLQTSLAGDRNVFGAPIGGPAAAATEIAKFGRQDQFGASALDGLADELLVMARSIGIRRVEQRDASIHRFTNDGDTLRIVARAVDTGQRHAA
jgi:hypothetical protein